MTSTRKSIAIFGMMLFLLTPLAGWSQPEASEGEARFLKNVRQLIYQGKRSGEGYFSADGKHLIFQSEREADNPFFQIYLLSFESGEIQRVSPGIGKTTCAFFRPATNQVLFSSTHLDPEAEAKQQAEIAFRATGKERRYSWDYDPYMDIFASQRDGSDIRRLTDSRGYDAEGSYSPDGSKIVFCSMRNAYPEENLSAEERKILEVDPAYFGEIYLMNADGSNQVRLTDWPGYDGGPFFSPDGRRIIWRHFEENGLQADIYTMNLDGSEVRRLTHFEAMSWAPYFHPSGEYAIFTSNKLGFSNFELSIVDAEGSKEPVRVTFTPGFDGLPVFSPDGNKLSWTSSRTSGGDSQLFLAEWDHQAALRALAAAPLRQTPATESDRAETTSAASATASSPPAESADAPPVGTPGFSTEVSIDDLRLQVGYLASDELKGRMTGSKGSEQAAAYLENYLQHIGLQPIGEERTYRQRFPFTSGINTIPEQNELQLMLSGEKKQTLNFALNEDFRPLGFAANGEVSGEVVFAGYGLKLPGDAGRGYNSYAGLDVQDKIALVLRYIPEDVGMERRQELNRYAGLRYKTLLARENGAKALLVVSGPNSPNAGELMPLKFDQSLGNSGIPVVSISGRVAEAIFAAAGKNLQEIQSGLDQENPHVESAFLLSNVSVTLRTGIEREKSYDSNVLGLLPPGITLKKPEYLVIGAHYDHLGLGESNSLARSGEAGQVHNGADDNGSGTALVMELAAALVKEREQNPGEFRRGIIFAFWSGEEIGIVGSSYFAENPTVPLESIAAYLNFDMVGRLRDNTLMVQGIGSSDDWKEMLEKRNVMAGFNLSLQEDPYLPTDVTAFYPKEVPILAFFTGAHEEYHRPVDDPATLNYQGLARIARFAQSLAYDLVRSPNAPGYVKVEPSSEQTGDRATLRAYLGTVPDYVSDVQGVKLSDVRPGGPAAKAGLQGGDIIVGFAGQEVKNIYDYTYALDAVKIGEPADIVVLRNGERLTLTIVPEARD